jgi:hypothetical protein
MNICTDTGNPRLAPACAGGGGGAFLRATWLRLTFRVECAWCGATIRGAILPVTKANTSHGICEPCKGKFLQSIKRKANT